MTDSNYEEKEPAESRRTEKPSSTITLKIDTNLLIKTMVIIAILAIFIVGFVAYQRNSSVQSAEELQETEGNKEATERQAEDIPTRIATGWVVGMNGMIAKTTNSGYNWRELNSDAVGMVSDVDFINDLFGWVLTQGTALHTTDGGETWVAQELPINSKMNNIWFINETEGWIGGLRFIVFHTNDGGNNWELIHRKDTVALPNIVELTDIVFTNEKNGWAIGTSTNDPYALYHTVDGGKNWEKVLIQMFQGSSLESIFFINDAVGWVVGDGLIFHTVDGGKNWASQTITPSYSITDVHFIDQDNGWAVGNQGLILRTENSGETWVTESYQTIDHNFKSVTFVNKKEGWAVIDYSRTLYYTNDGGIHWMQLKEYLPGEIMAIDFLGPEEGY